MIRFVQVSIIAGMLFLYKYMLSSRKKYYRNISNKKERVEEAKGERVAEKSPRRESKRD